MGANMAAPQPPARPPGLPVVKATPAAKPGYRRAIQVGLRSVHLVSMGLLLGGIGMGATGETLLGPIIATLASGALLLVVSMQWGCFNLSQGAGWALLLKLGLLGLGHVVEGARLQCYAAATMVSSIGSHMPGEWRHFKVADALRWARRSGARSA